MKKLRLILAITALITVSACAKHTTIRKFTNAESIIQDKQQMTIMPASVEINTMDIAGKLQRMHDYEYSIEDIVARELVKALNEKGYSARHITKRELHEKKLSGNLLDLKNKYDEQLKSSYKTRLLKEEFAFNSELGVENLQKKIAKKTSSELLVISTYYNTIKTNGARFKDLSLAVLGAYLGNTSIGNYDSEASTLYVGIIDGDNGRLLWNNVASRGKTVFGSAIDNTQKQEEVDTKYVQDIIEEILKPLPSKN